MAQLPDAPQVRLWVAADPRPDCYLAASISRLKSRSQGGETETRVYDEGGYGKGKLTSVTDATGSTSYVFNADGSLATQTNVIVGTSLTTSWGYNSLGQVTSMTYPHGGILNYGYDGVGRLSTITTHHAQWPTLASNFSSQGGSGLAFKPPPPHNTPPHIPPQNIEFPGMIYRLTSRGYRHELINPFGDVLYAQMVLKARPDPNGTCRWESDKLGRSNRALLVSTALATRGSGRQTWHTRPARRHCQ